MYLRVALDVPLNTLFDYSWTGGAVAPGTRVLVPFGRRNAVGVVVGSSDSTDVPVSRIKPVARLFCETPPLSPEILRLLQFCSDYYQHPLGETIFNALPAAMRQTKPLSLPKPEFYCLTANGRNVDPDTLPSRAVAKRRLLQVLRAANSLSRSEIAVLSPTTPTALKTFIELGWVEESKSDTPIPPFEKGGLGGINQNPAPATKKLEAGQ